MTTALEECNYNWAAMLVTWSATINQEECGEKSEGSKRNERTEGLRGQGFQEESKGSKMIKNSNRGKGP